MMIHNLLFALRLIQRDWRSGELTILVAALMIAVASATAVSLLDDRLARTMTLQAAEFLAADLVISAHQEIPEDWRQKARHLRLRQAKTTEFTSVLVENDELLLVGVKAVTEGYPLRSFLRTTTSNLDATTATHEIPRPGEAWVEPRVLSTLGLSLGNSLAVGEKNLRITRIITHEPDRRGDLFSLSPRLLINAEDLASTGVIQPGSHIHYYELFAGEESAIRQFKHWLKPKIQSGQRILDVHEDRPEVGNALSRAKRYLGLTSMAVVLIAGVAIAMSARRYTERHFDLTAMLKTLGTRERDVLGIYLLQFFCIGSAASLLGGGLGWGLQQGVLYLLRNLLPPTIVAPGGLAIVFGALTGLLILFGFALPPLLRLKRLPPLRVLRRDLEPLPSSLWLVYGFALATLAILMSRYTADWTMTLSILGIGGASVILFGLFILALLKLGRYLVPQRPLFWRFGLQQLTRRPGLTISQLMAFSITLVAMLVSLMVRTELLQEWKRQLPENTPNYFALNLFDSDLERYREFLVREGISDNPYYPIVRGRLTSVNGQDVFQIVEKGSRAEASINRELSLTWSPQLPYDNQIISGKWWNPEHEPPLRISMESELAKNLGIQVGDQLSFNIGGRNLTGTVASTRSVRWDTLTPNFFMIFSPGSLNDQPHTWLTSFYLPPEKKSVLGTLVKTFPSVTLLEVDALLKQFQTILRQITKTIEYVLLLALGAGFTVLFAAVRATLDERMYEDVLLRSMGASRQLILRSQWVEFSTLGGLAGILAAALSEIISGVLFIKIFDLTYRFHWENWLVTPILGALTVGIAGYLNTRSIVRNSPLQVLQQL
jgi:putative ABC transport system permease protein